MPIVFSLLISATVQAQNILETYEFANRQFEAGNYGQALTEYQRVAFFDENKNYRDVYLKIADSFFEMGDFDRAVKNYDIAFRLSDSDSLKAEIVFKKARCMFEQNNFVFALNELYSLAEPASPYLKNKYNLYTGIACFGIENYPEALAYFNKIVSPENSAELKDLFDRFGKIQKRYKPSKVQNMSIFLPGLGQFYTGNIGSGINSMVLISGIAVLTVHLWQIYGFLEAALSTGSWYYRYYSGGYKNAGSLAVEKIEHERAELYNRVLNLISSEI